MNMQFLAYKLWNEFQHESGLHFAVDGTACIYLPNGEQVTSVEQTQEFFNV